MPTAAECWPEFGSDGHFNRRTSGSTEPRDCVSVGMSSVIGAGSLSSFDIKMSTLGPTPSVMSSGTDFRRLLIPIALLVPGASYFALIVLSVFGVRSPARWLLDEFITTGWSACILLGIVIGCPMLSAVGSLMVRTRRRPGYTVAGVCGVLAVVVIAVNTLFGFWLLVGLLDD